MYTKVCENAGVDLGYSLGGGGGGCKICVPTHVMSVKPKDPYSQGPGPAQGPWKWFWCYLSLICKHFDTKWDLKGGGKYIVDQNF